MATPNTDCHGAPPLARNLTSCTPDSQPETLNPTLSTLNREPESRLLHSMHAELDQAPKPWGLGSGIRLSVSG